MCCAPYKAIVGLEDLGACCDGGAGPQLLAELAPSMQLHVLKCVSVG